MKRLPAVKNIAAEIQASHRKVEHAVEHLVRHRDAIIGYDDVELFALADDLEIELPLVAPPAGTVKCFETVRTEIARALWGLGIYVGRSVIETLLYEALRRGGDPVLQTLEIVRDDGLHRPGFTVFPLLDAGILGGGWYQWAAKTRLQFNFVEGGCFLTPQARTKEAALANIEAAGSALGVGGRVPMDLLEHWLRSRPTAWIYRNPLICVRTRSFPGTYFENGFFLRTRLRMATTLVMMHAALEPSAAAPTFRALSTRNVNYDPTLNARHYLVFYPSPGTPSRLSGDCVPVNSDRLEFLEDCTVPIEVDPDWWRRRSSKRSRLAETLSAVESGFMREVVLSRDLKESVRGRVYRKTMVALRYFRQSFRAEADYDRAVVALGTAFEVLLTDGYSPGVGRRITRRVRLALRGVPGTRELQENVRDLYGERSRVLHDGRTSEFDLAPARVTFVHVFERLVARFDQLPAASGSPIGDILGDTSG